MDFTRRRLVMNDYPLFAPLDNLIALSVHIAYGAARHSLGIIRIIIFRFYRLDLPPCHGLLAGCTTAGRYGTPLHHIPLPATKSVASSGVRSPSCTCSATSEISSSSSWQGQVLFQQNGFPGV